PEERVALGGAEEVLACRVDRTWEIRRRGEMGGIARHPDRHAHCAPKARARACVVGTVPPRARLAAPHDLTRAGGPVVRRRLELTCRERVAFCTCCARRGAQAIGETRVMRDDRILAGDAR